MQPIQIAKPGLQEAHVLSVEDVCRHFNVKIDSGLSEAGVKKQIAEFGLNSLPEEEPKSIWASVFDQLNDTLVRILLAAACISFVLALFEEDGQLGRSAFLEPVVILIILTLNAMVGVWQEANAERALSALKKLQPELASCLRGGHWGVMPSADLVPGDIIDIRSGDKVAADCRILSICTTSLRIIESQLTGESTSVEKHCDALPKNMTDAEIQYRRNMLYGGTTVANGHAIACVVSTALATEMGKIQQAVQMATECHEKTPLAQKMEEFGESLTYAVGAICVIVWAVNFRNFWDPSHGGPIKGCIYYFKIAIALAVAAIPEGLPAVTTTSLALGTRRMAKKKAVIRQLMSVETLGCTTVICSDKTGTLTTNKMCCQLLCLPAETSMHLYAVEGTSYHIVGAVTPIDNSPKIAPVLEKSPGIHWFCKTLSICNTSRLEYSDEQVNCVGEPTEGALRVLVEKLGCPDKLYNETHFGKFDHSFVSPFNAFWTGRIDNLSTLEFTRERKAMAVLGKDHDANCNILYVKGAPEYILESCTEVVTSDGKYFPMNDRKKQAYYDQLSKMTSKTLRVLAIAIRRNCGALADYTGRDHVLHPTLVDTANFPKFEKELTFCGFVGILDPPREEVPGAIQACREAQLRVIMITGDNKTTAEAIAVQTGILSPKEVATRSLTGREFNDMSHDEKKAFLATEGAVFSRTEPLHKQTIVRILKENGAVVAMTGDGVNDAPALKIADIGIAMGISGTEVAKEASAMVLADDNFSTIVAAVEEGRAIYSNMKAFIRYLISSNIGEVASIFLTSALGIPESFAPMQLLWVNLVTDGLPAIALGFNPHDNDIMKKPPRGRDEPLMTRWILFRYLCVGFYVGISTVGIFVSWYLWGVDPNDGQTLVSMNQLRNWSECPYWEDFTANNVYDMKKANPCTYFMGGKRKASTLSLTVLVAIEMCNALNALSEEASLLSMPPWANPWLLLAVAGSLAVHCGILYIPFFSQIFNTTPLTMYDWTVVTLWALPVIALDEGLKYFARRNSRKNLEMTLLKRGSM